MSGGVRAVAVRAGTAEGGGEASDGWRERRIHTFGEANAGATGGPPGRGAAAAGTPMMRADWRLGFDLGVNLASLFFF